jgi:hypothetical protein
MNVVILLGKKLGIYLSAVLLAYTLASISATQHVVSSLASMGLSPDARERLLMTVQDLVGMSGMFLPLIAFGFLVALLVTALLHYWLKRWQTALYVLAGATALIAIHVLLKLAFNITPVAIARDPGGLLVQGLCGAAGGYLYIFLNRRLGSRPFDAVDDPDLQ